MPSKDSHLAAAAQNQRTMERLLQLEDDHLGWVATVGFYKALHVIEAVLAADKHAPVHHTDDHSSRNKMLRKTNRYANLWKYYKPLYDISLIARYLREDQNGPTHDVFKNYLPRHKIESVVINHYLHQVEKSAARLLDVEDLFKSA